MHYVETHKNDVGIGTNIGFVNFEFVDKHAPLPKNSVTFGLFIANGVEGIGGLSPHFLR